MAEPGVRPPGAASPSANQDEIPLASLAGRMKKFSEHTSTIPEVMDSSTLNFLTQISKVFAIFSLGGTRNPFGWVLVSLDQSLACVKISGRSTP